MIWIVPAPGGQPNEIILTIELQPLNIGPNYHLILGIRPYIINVKPGLVILLPALRNAVILDLKVLNVFWVLAV